MSNLYPVAVSQDSENLAEQPKTAGESHLLLLKQKKYCDVTFKFPNLPNRIKAHEIYLKARSPVFEQIFRMRKSANVQGNEIEISESTPETFQQFLEFIYADKFEADISGALDLLQLAQKYKVQPLTEKCEELMKTEIKAEDSVKVFEAARRYGRQDLMDRAGQIMVKSFSNLIETGALANAEEVTVVYLLERGDLNIEEVKLFQLILHWGKNQVEETGDEQSFEDKLKNVISKIRYTNMTLLEFTKLVLPTGLLSAEESLSVYSYLAGDEATRSALNIKFNTTGRIFEKLEKFVDFFVEKQFRFDWAPGFDTQRVIFKVERQSEAQVVTKEWFGCLQKTAVISKIQFQWPVTCERHPEIVNQNMGISIVEWYGSSAITRMGNRKFDMRLHLNGSHRSNSEKIDVKPPVKLIPGRKYAVILQNHLPMKWRDLFRNRTNAYYGHVLATSDCTASRDVLLENCCLDLKETRMETIDFNSDISNSPFTLVLIKGITIELV